MGSAWDELDNAPSDASWPFHPPVYTLLEVGGSFCYHIRDLFTWLCFPFLKQEYSKGLWTALETTGTAENKGSLLASPAQMSGHVHYKLPTPLTEIPVRKRGWKGAQAIPPKTIHRLVVPSVHYL